MVWCRNPFGSKGIAPRRVFHTPASFYERCLFPFTEQRRRSRPIRLGRNSMLGHRCQQMRNRAWASDTDRFATSCIARSESRRATVLRADALQLEWKRCLAACGARFLSGQYCGARSRPMRQPDSDGLRGQPCINSSIRSAMCCAGSPPACGIDLVRVSAAAARPSRERFRAHLLADRQRRRTLALLRRVPLERARNHSPR